MGKNKLKNKERVYYLDYLKVFLIILVVAHHALEAYSNESQWKYKDTVTTEWIKNMHTINATFFMGLFFFISGYFVVNSLKKRGRKAFIIAKAKQLLLPVIFMMIILIPLEYYIAGCAMGTIHSNFFNYYVKVYLGTGIISYEHGWYLVSLFLFCILYVILKKIINENVIKKIGRLNLKKIIVISIIIAIFTYIMHIYYSFDQWITVLGGIGIEPVHYPQYIILFIAGTIAYEKDWLNEIDNKIGWTSVVLSLIMIVFVYLRSYLDSDFFNKIYSFYYIYEAFICIAICIALLFIFRKYFNFKSKFLIELSKCSFKVYVWHILFVLIFQVSLKKCLISATYKFFIVTVMATISTFIFVYLIKRIKSKLFSKRVIQ